MVDVLISGVREAVAFAIRRTVPNKELRGLVQVWIPSSETRTGDQGDYDLPAFWAGSGRRKTTGQVVFLRISGLVCGSLESIDCIRIVVQ